ncbi:HupE/UreJ family protein [Parvularcula sp. IMCC14364]|uniref:HupE/UreJ family protein n=1 Tax=Parvularcula sp. IMCC14364 TaxID=3067902 RepID=UPI0027421B68|nr:HupE/UreJ family protein [Parvularcula sp. IMCC14364]
MALSTGPGYAHPEDEFCTADSGLDPELCRALAELDSAGAADPQSAFYGTTEVQAIELDRPVLETIGLYIKLGFIHILPRGYDHILFVLALFLASTKWRPLLLQVSAFTLAHTLTLGLAAAGFISVPAGIVEPLIALSIAVVAIENIFFRELTRWRPAVVFGFGLFHGLGFAGVLSDLGLVRDQFLVSLISFNVGVEFGQLAVIGMALAATLLARRFVPMLSTEAGYRQYVVWPASGLIAVMGLFWFLSRVFG